MRIPEFIAERALPSTTAGCYAGIETMAGLDSRQRVEPADVKQVLKCILVSMAAGWVCGPVCSIIASLLCNEGKAE